MSLRRIVPILSGFSILGIIFNHVNWNVLTRYAAGSAGGYPFVAIGQLGDFAVAGYVFIAGYFIAYATNGGKNDLPWGVVRARLLTLLWPWLIWAAVMTVGHVALGDGFSVVGILRMLFIQYYFVPLLIFYYLLAPFEARLARKNARQLLALSALVQLVGIALFYLRVYSPLYPNAYHFLVDIGPLQYLRFALFFPLGLAVGMYPQKARSVISRFKPVLPVLLVVFFALAAAEASFVYSLGGDHWPVGSIESKLTSTLFALAVIGNLLAFDNIKVPFDQFFSYLGMHSYGLYLSHYLFLSVLSKLITRLLPGVFARAGLYMPLLFGLTVTLAIFIMEITARAPVKRFYRYVYG